MSELFSKATVSMFIVGMATISLVACGKSATDKNYSNLMANNPISYQDALKQNAAGAQESVPGIYVIITADQAKSVTVHEGETVTITGTARIQIPGLDFKVAAKNAPSDAQFTVTPDANGVKRWSLTWKTPTGKIPAGQEFIEVQPSINVTPTNPSADNQNLLKADYASNSLTLGLDIKVQAVSEKPLVQSIIGLDGNPTEGVAVPFEIDVNDPGSLAATPPAIQISADKAKAAADGNIDVSSFIALDPAKPAQSAGNGNWKFFFVFNSGDTLLPRPAKHSTVGVDEARATFMVSLLSPSKLSSSSAQSFNLKLNTAKQAPVLTAKDLSQLTQITMGKANQIDIDVKSNDPDGKMTIDRAGTRDALKGLPGLPKVKCDAQVGQDMACHITWTPSCTADVATTEVLQLKMNNTVGGISAPGVWSSDPITLVKPDQCGVKAKATAKPKPTVPVKGAAKAPVKAKAQAPVKAAAKPAKPVPPTAPVKAAPAPAKVTAAAAAANPAAALVKVEAAAKTQPGADKKAPTAPWVAPAAPKAAPAGANPAQPNAVDAKAQKADDVLPGGIE